VTLKFDNAGNFSGGLAPVSYRSRWGFIDKSGKMVIEAKYVAAAQYTEWGALVVDDKGWGFYIDRHGKKVNPVNGVSMGEAAIAGK